MRTYIYVLLASLLSFNGFAQTGNFSTKIKFNGEDRTVAWHIPGDYDNSKSYRLIIGLHGLGDNAENYRNAVINTLNWPSIFPNTLFAFPDGGEDQNSDFYAPEGDEDFVDITLKQATSTYNIDTKQVILQGFSLGGSSALKYGLEHTATFEALLLNTPAIQGFSTAANVLGEGFAYENANALPIFITHGEDDVLYTPSINEAVRRLKTNKGKVEYIVMKGVGHRLPGKQILDMVVPFVTNPASKTYDIDVFDIYIPSRVCSDEVTGQVMVQNRGNIAVTEIELQPSLDGSAGTAVLWQGNLKPFETVGIPVMFKGDHGKHNLSIMVGSINSSQTDEHSDNNTISKSVFLNANDALTPVFVEDFDGDSEGWLLEESSTIFSWFHDDDVKKSGSSSFGNFNTILIFNTLGNKEYFESPVVDLSKINKPGITFDLAYSYHRYTPPYFTDTVNITDTLEVQISTDCGLTYETIYRQWGEKLATAKEPITNPLQVSDCFFTPTDDEWRNVGINLSKYKNAQNAVIRFNYISGLGGSINIDNIEFGSDLNAPDQSKNQMRLFPNPAQNEFSIYIEGRTIKEVKLINSLGQIIYENSEIDQEYFRLNSATINSGFYTVEVVANSNLKYTSKVMVQH